VVTALYVLGFLLGPPALIVLAGYQRQSNRRRAEDRARKGVRR
jgi:hypothetical protein